MDDDDEEKQNLSPTTGTTKQKTEELKQQLVDGKTVENILPEAFALVREAGKRVFGMRHFDVQMIGGMV